MKIMFFHTNIQLKWVLICMPTLPVSSVPCLMTKVANLLWNKHLEFRKRNAGDLESCLLKADQRDLLKGFMVPNLKQTSKLEHFSDRNIFSLAANHTSFCVLYCSRQLKLQNRVFIAFNEQSKGIIMINWIWEF